MGFDIELLELLRTIFQEENNDQGVAQGRKFEIMPDPCSILERQGQIVATGNVVSAFRLGHYDL